jgi:glycosyltransferase involved in cell wall biosynthesis
VRPESELLIVDDASTDQSADVAGGLAARHPEVRVLTHDSRRGYGACISSALAVVRHPLVLLTACDYPYPPGDISKLLDVIDTVDVVVGCRTDVVPLWLHRWDATFSFFVRTVFGVAMEPRPGWRGWPACWKSVKYRMLFGLRTWDPTCAFTLYRRSVLERIPIQSDGEFIRVELLAKANFLGCLMAEAPIGRLAGNFKGVPEPSTAGGSGDAGIVFRRPLFAAAKTSEPDV